MIWTMAWISVDQLPAVNASLNLVAAGLLVLGYVLIRSRRERAHRAAMVAAFAVSSLFLVSYLVYHNQVGHVSFEGPATARTVYLIVLMTHIPLAALVPFLALAAIALAATGRRAAHRRLARWALPIWLYVSVTGVIVYVMLYQMYPPDQQGV